MTGSTYAPQKWQDIEASKVAPHVVGIQSTIVALSSPQVIDTLISDDCLIRSVELMGKSISFTDYLTVQVVDKDGVYFPAGAILSTPVSNYNLVSDQQRQSPYESIAPFKILGGLYIRISYYSFGLVNVSLGANFVLPKLLV